MNVTNNIEYSVSTNDCSFNSDYGNDEKNPLICQSL
jgi:hypothetical protein